MYSLYFTFTFFKTSCSLSHSFELSFDITGCKEKIRWLKSRPIIWCNFKEVYKQLCIRCTLISCRVVGDCSPFRPFWAASCSAANFSACNLSSSALAEAIRAASAASAAALRSACETRSPSCFTMVTSVGWKRIEYRASNFYRNRKSILFKIQMKMISIFTLLILP